MSHAANDSADGGKQPNSRRGGALRTIAAAFAWAVGAAAIGLVVNAVRADRLPLIAPWPYESDCPDKLDLSTPLVDPARALVLAKRTDIALIDARQPEHYQASHADGSISMPYSPLLAPLSRAQVRRLATFRWVLIYCDSPESRVAHAHAEQMRSKGLVRVKVVRGGWRSLRAKAAR